MQISDIISIFEWEGKIEHTKEYKLTIKTTKNQYSNIEKLILENHNYKLPQIITIDISGGFKKYLNWLNL